MGHSEWKKVGSFEGEIYRKEKRSGSSCSSAIGFGCVALLIVSIVLANKIWDLLGPDDYGTKRFKESIVELEERVRAGDPAAMWELGMDYYSGATLRTYGEKYWDPVRGLELIKMASDNNHGEAQYHLAKFCYRPSTGDCPGIRANNIEYVALMGRAAQNDYARAQCLLHLMTGAGEYGIRQDAARARYWCNRSKEQGFDCDCQY